MVLIFTVCNVKKIVLLGSAYSLSLSKVIVVDNMVDINTV